MISRCYRPYTKGYARYGGRGIRVCRRWLGPTGIVRFIKDMGVRPSLAHSLDRKRVNGNYTPGNCRWSTALEQGANRRDSVRITAFGKTLTLQQWARTTGIHRDTIGTRLKLGWAPADALTRDHEYPYHAIAKAAKRFGMSPSSIYSRLRSGWSLERALTTPRQVHRGASYVKP
jgi:hypothetical protein